MNTERISLVHPTDRPNYGIVHLGPVMIGFSYRTPVHVAGPAGRATIQNYWGPTTGKHLNDLDGGRKAERVDKDEFARVLAANLAALGAELVAG